MNSGRLFYLCPVCFRCSEVEDECHAHRMVVCDAGEWGDERRKPIVDEIGRMHTRAPRWFLEAVGWMPARPG
ncbi:MAG TPA: hypothetical protein VJG32_02915 [Anaerolineae bacterium]|nr:hypothetical protein [Anaerolineae bacterium]